MLLDGRKQRSIDDYNNFIKCCSVFNNICKRDNHDLLHIRKRLHNTNLKESTSIAIELSGHGFNAPVIADVMHKAPQNIRKFINETHT